MEFRIYILQLSSSDALVSAPRVVERPNCIGTILMASSTRTPNLRIPSPSDKDMSCVQAYTNSITHEHKILYMVFFFIIE